MNTTEGTARHIAIYTRISQDKEKDQRAVSRQKADCEKHVKQLQEAGRLSAGVRIEHYCDNDISAYQTKKPRKHFERMLADAESGYVEAIVAYHADRLYRRVPDLYRVARAVKDSPNLTVQTVKSGLVDFSTPSGRLAAVMLALIAEYEVEIKSDRQQSESDQIAQSGEPRRGGRRPFGYEKDQPGPKGRYVVIKEDEAAEIRNATQRLLDGASVTSLIKDWNERGVLTVQAQELPARRAVLKARQERGEVLIEEEVTGLASTPSKWQHSSFVALMIRYRNAGIRQHRGQPVGDASWPAIVEKADFEKLRNLLLDPSRLTGSDKSRKHLLSFIVTCSRCDVGMRGAAVKVPYTPVGGTKRYSRYMTYQCPGHKAAKDAPCRLSITYEVAENAVKAYIADRLATPDADLLAVHDAERSELRTLRQRRAELDADERVIEKASISLASRTRQLEAVQAERLLLDAQVKSIGQRVALASLLTEAAPPRLTKAGRVDFDAAAVAKAAAMVHFEALSLAQRREIVRALCAVVVMPSQKGVSYKYGRAYERVLVYPRNPVSGVLSDVPVRGCDLVGKLDSSGRVVGFTHDEVVGLEA